MVDNGHRLVDIGTRHLWGHLALLGNDVVQHTLLLKVLLKSSLDEGGDYSNAMHDLGSLILIDCLCSLRRCSLYILHVHVPSGIKLLPPLADWNFIIGQLLKNFILNFSLGSWDIIYIDIIPVNEALSLCHIRNGSCYVTHIQFTMLVPTGIISQPHGALEPVILILIQRLTLLVLGEVTNLFPIHSFLVNMGFRHYSYLTS